MLNQRFDRGMTQATITETEARTHVAAFLADPGMLKQLEKAVFRAVGDTGANEDIVMDACVKILANAESFDWSKGDFMGWAMTIAANIGRNWRKASANHGHYSEGTGGEEGDDAPDEKASFTALVDTLIGSDGRADAMRANEAQWLAAAIETLDSDAQAFLGHMADGLGQTEAGAKVGWSPATATRRYRSIVATLAEQA